MLHIEHLTKDYGNGQGVFDVWIVKRGRSSDWWEATEVERQR